MKILLMSVVFLFITSCSHFRGGCSKTHNPSEPQASTQMEQSTDHPCNHHKDCDKKDCTNCKEGKCPNKKGDNTPCEKCQKGDCDKCQNQKCDKCKSGKCPLKKDKAS